MLPFRKALASALVEYHHEFIRARRELNTLSFSDCEIEALRLLTDNEKVRDEYHEKFRYVIVDEYQDIDADQYELVSLVAGKSREEGERKMAILAVGDDDQNIYRFRGASVEFIRRFQRDYQAGIHYLVENYRSTANIVNAANYLIAHNTDRMKTGHPIRINQARQNLPSGGNWQLSDPVARGKVQILQVADAEAQALVLLEQAATLFELFADARDRLGEDVGHLERVRGYVDLGVEEGASLVVDGRDLRRRRP